MQRLHYSFSPQALHRVSSGNDYSCPFFSTRLLFARAEAPKVQHYCLTFLRVHQVLSYADLFEPSIRTVVSQLFNSFRFSRFLISFCSNRSLPSIHFLLLEQWSIAVFSLDFAHCTLLIPLIAFHSFYPIVLKQLRSLAFVVSYKLVKRKINYDLNEITPYTGLNTYRYRIAIHLEKWRQTFDPFKADVCFSQRSDSSEGSWHTLSYF